jgi:hypothetical protein
MGGKAILIVVLSISLTFFFIGVNYNRMTLSASDNMTNYANKQISHSIAVTGANIACNAFYIDPNWTAGYSNVSCMGGSYSVTVQTLDAVKLIKSITCISTFKGFKDTVHGAVLYYLPDYHDTIIVTFQPSRFSRYAYYSSSEGGSPIYWATGDTVKGPLQTQDYLRVSGNPVFLGFVGTKLGVVNKNGSADHPQFLGGLLTGSNIPINTSGVSTVESFALTNGYEFSGHDTVYLNFQGDSVKYRYAWNTKDTTKKLSTMTPNGVLFVKGGTARIRGKIKGQYTLGCSYVSKGGSVYLDSSIAYNTNPISNPSSTDILGVVTQNNFTITDNKANNNSVTIQASIYCQSGSFGAENYSTRGYDGYINLLGGVIQAIRGAVGVIGSDGSITNGFSKSYSYDRRFMFSAPPNFPNTGSYNVISWYE